MSDICCVCSKECSSSRRISCYLCKKTFHPVCVQLKPADMEFIKEQKMNIWQCPTCLQEGRRHRSGSVSSASVRCQDAATQENVVITPDQFDRLFAEISSIKLMQRSIMDDLEQVKAGQGQLSAEINAKCGKLQNEIKLCNDTLSNHTSTLDEHTKSIVALNTKMQKIEGDLKSEFLSGRSRSATAGSTRGPSDASDMDSVVAELAERQKRAKNVMIFGVVEATGSNAGERRAADGQFVGTLFEFLGTNPVPANVTRIGSFAEGKRRPIKVLLQSEADVLLIVKAAKKLRGAANYDGISISLDRTPRQLCRYRELKAQLDDRKASGEQNLKIRYISGVPTIINLN